MHGKLWQCIFLNRTWTSIFEVFSCICNKTKTHHSLIVILTITPLLVEGCLNLRLSLSGSLKKYNLFSLSVNVKSLTLSFQMTCLLMLFIEGHFNLFPLCVPTIYASIHYLTESLAVYSYRQNIGPNSTDGPVHIYIHFLFYVFVVVNE